MQIQIFVPEMCEEQILTINFYFVTPERETIFGETMTCVLYIRQPNFGGNPDLIASRDFKKEGVAILEEPQKMSD